MSCVACAPHTVPTRPLGPTRPTPRETPRDPTSYDAQAPHVLAFGRPTSFFPPGSDPRGRAPACLGGARRPTGPGTPRSPPRARGICAACMARGRPSCLVSVEVTVLRSVPHLHMDCTREGLGKGAKGGGPTGTFRWLDDGSRYRPSRASATSPSRVADKASKSHRPRNGRCRPAGRCLTH